MPLACGVGHSNLSAHAATNLDERLKAFESLYHVPHHFGGDMSNNLLRAELRLEQSVDLGAVHISRGRPSLHSSRGRSVYIRVYSCPPKYGGRCRTQALKSFEGYYSIERREF